MTLRNSFSLFIVGAIKVIDVFTLFEVGSLFCLWWESKFAFKLCLNLPNIGTPGKSRIFCKLEGVAVLNNKNG